MNKIVWYLWIIQKTKGLNYPSKIDLVTTNQEEVVISCNIC